MPPADLQRRTQWAGLASGDPVRVEGTRIRGASWIFQAHVTNTESGEEWVEVVGGRGGDRSVRSFRPDQLYAVSARPGRDPSLVDEPRRASPSPEFHTMAIPTLTTERLILRPLTLDDLTDLTVIHAEESFWWYPLRSGMTAGQTADFLRRHIERYETDGFGVEALVEKESGRLIGWAGLAVPHFLPQILPAVEVGWRLASASRGKGLATEAGQAAVDWGFLSGGLTRIVSIYEPENVASGKVMEHLGFTPYLTTAGDQHGKTVIVTELTIETWRERRSHG